MKLNAEMMETEGAAAHRRRVCVLPSSRYLQTKLSSVRDASSALCVCMQIEEGLASFLFWPNQCFQGTLTFFARPHWSIFAQSQSPLSPFMKSWDSIWGGKEYTVSSDGVSNSTLGVCLCSAALHRQSYKPNLATTKARTRLESLPLSSYCTFTFQ